jgi:hypothetical protein
MCVPFPPPLPLQSARQRALELGASGTKELNLEDEAEVSVRRGEPGRGTHIAARQPAPLTAPPPPPF